MRNDGDTLRISRVRALLKTPWTVPWSRQRARTSVFRWRDLACKLIGIGATWPGGPAGDVAGFRRVGAVAASRAWLIGGLDGVPADCLDRLLTLRREVVPGLGLVEG